MEIKWLLTCACRSVAFCALLNFALVPPETFSALWQSGNGRPFEGDGRKVDVAVAQLHSCLSEIESECLCCVSWANRPPRLSASNDTATPPALAITGGGCLAVGLVSRLLLLSRCVYSFTSMLPTASYKRVKWSCLKSGTASLFSLAVMYKSVACQGYSSGVKRICRTFPTIYYPIFFVDKVCWKGKTVWAELALHFLVFTWENNVSSFWC